MPPSLDTRSSGAVGATGARPSAVLSGREGRPADERRAHALQPALLTMTHSIWSSVSRRASFPQLQEKNLHVDVVIVGGGITGVTTAFLLKSSGKRVALLEAQSIGSGVTGKTAAHLTEAIDTRYSVLEKAFGAEGARLAAQSSRAAIEMVGELDARLSLRADFERLPGYLYSERDADVETLRRELEAARAAGLVVEFGSAPLPFPVAGAICFRNQAQFNPITYLTGLAGHVVGNGSQVYEQSRVVSIHEDEPCRITLEHGVVLTAERVVLATNAPLNRLLLQTKVSSYRSYVVAGQSSEPLHGLFWDTDDPYHYVRSLRAGNRNYLVVGGEDHKTGQESNTHERFDKLLGFATRFGLRNAEYRWSAQVVEPVDGLPLIGRNGSSDAVFVATGFSGNGTTFGTVAAMILRDACLDQLNPYADLFHATRIKPLAALTTFVEENVDFPLHLVVDRVRKPDAGTLEEIGMGQGKIVRAGGERIAAYRDEEGHLHAVSPVCTHLGCHVTFNDAEKSWDCPCHGSRFDVDGRILNGPAIRPLASRTPSATTR